MYPNIGRVGGRCNKTGDTPRRRRPEKPFPTNRRLGELGKTYRPLTEVEMELARAKKELAEVKMERDILKKAAAYFAKESLPGTR